MWGRKRLEREADRLAEEILAENRKDFDLLAESVATQIADVLSEQGYVQAFGAGPGDGLVASDQQVREETIRRTRMAAFTKSLGYAPIRKLTEFSLGGNGLTKPVVKVAEERGGEEEAERQQAYLDKFWNEELNQKQFTGRCAQYAFSDKLQYDGEVFIGIFAGADVRLTQPVIDVPAIRLIGTLEIVDPIITDPTDSAAELGYWRKEVKQEFSLSGPTKSTTQPAPTLYASTLVPEYYRRAKGSSLQFINNLAQKAKHGVWLYHAAVGADPTENRGWPLTARVVGWLEKHETVFKDAMQFLRSLLQFAWRQKLTPGTKSQMARQRALRQLVFQKLTAKAIPGSTIVENVGSTTEPISTPTGGIQIADMLAKKIELMIGAATGWPHNYLTGDISQGTLATARSMELPVIKLGRYWQAVLYSTYKNVLDFVLKMRFGDLAGTVELGFSPMLEDDIPAMVTALTNAAVAGTLPFDTDPETGEPGATDMIRETLRRRV